MQKKNLDLSRRNFLGVVAGACAAPLLVPNTVFGQDGTAPNERLNVVFIGVGNRGNEVIGDFGGNRGTRITGVCDCYTAHAERGRDKVNNIYRNKDCKIYPKYEEVLEDKAVDVVVVTTPDHWHTKMTVEACKAGKDVYCEKPLTLTLAEGKHIVAAARKYNRVCTSGSQRVWQDYGHYMAPVIQSGAIGEVTDIYSWSGNPPKICYTPEEQIPVGMDWDRWLGQAPFSLYSQDRSSGSYGGGWRQYGDYGNGFLADWGAHKFGGAMYSMGMDDQLPIKIIPPGVDENENSRNLTMVFKNGLRLHHAPGYDITFKGTEREFRNGDRSIKPLKPVELRTYSGGATNIVGDFVYCVKNRLRPFQDLFYGATTAGICQLAAIGYRLGRTLNWDPEKYDFVNDDQASRFISRPQRPPYTYEV